MADVAVPARVSSVGLGIASPSEVGSPVLVQDRCLSHHQTIPLRHRRNSRWRFLSGREPRLRFIDSLPALPSPGPPSGVTLYEAVTRSAGPSTSSGRSSEQAYPSPGSEHDVSGLLSEAKIQDLIAFMLALPMAD